ncbi:cupin domain-containing protein [Rhodoligotrophos ferricapiens]|uniref:cupin domain-containing protein n=1 Tax=Rhodoligotrophos ferricapiens TaxID=3069264 RepID=UPI00315D60BB
MQPNEIKPSDPRQSAEASDIGTIVKLGSAGISAYVPPLSDYQNVSETWQEAEYRCYETEGRKVTIGYWTGEPGQISLDPWPYTEVCSIVTGRVALRDQRGKEIVFGAGEGFLVPKGWAGAWITLEPSSKFFVMIT